MCSLSNYLCLLGKQMPNGPVIYSDFLSFHSAPCFLGLGGGGESCRQMNLVNINGMQIYVASAQGKPMSITSPRGHLQIPS